MGTLKKELYYTWFKKNRYFNDFYLEILLGKGFQRGVCGAHTCVCGEGREFYKEKHFLPHFIINNNNIKFKEPGLLSVFPPHSPLSASCWNEVGNERLGLEGRVWPTLEMYI